MKKTFLITMFGEPFSWINEYIENVQQLGQFGWEWKIFTPAKIASKGNVEIVEMSASQFADLTGRKLGVRPNMYITSSGVPSVHVTDFYVASGIILEDYIKDSDFWGITNLDVVYGRLDHFLPDSTLEKIDVFTDDINRTVNGVFSLWRNTEKVNKLFMQIPQWREKFGQPPCPRCIGVANSNHTLFGTDEYDMTRILRDEKDLRIGSTNEYPLHSHDRLEQHYPEIKLSIKQDGSLWELFRDLGAPEWEHKREFLGREIMYFHFIRTKKWPQCLSN